MYKPNSRSSHTGWKPDPRSRRHRRRHATSVKAGLANAAASDGVRVRIFGARSIGTPYISFYTLTNPVIADGTMTFAAPASATLRKDAGYFVVFDSTASDAGNDYEIRGTESDSLNRMADGWSLSEDRHARNKDSASWTTDSAVPLIEINGDAVVEATDANLSALRMRDGNGKLVTYSPFFDSSITSYATSASPKVDRITIQATASNGDGATVVYLDEDDQQLTDADAVQDGFQVDLEVGPNTINVRVTAEEGSTTRTYTMVVTRKASRVSADALASNLDELFSKRFYVGNLEPGKVLRAQALGFETGDNEAGYVLTSVKGDRKGAIARGDRKGTPTVASHQLSVGRLQGPTPCAGLAGCRQRPGRGADRNAIARGEIATGHPTGDRKGDRKGTPTVVSPRLSVGRLQGPTPCAGLAGCRQRPGRGADHNTSHHRAPKRPSHT
ncbi:MAG: cadherin-like beta sandwich domain-containing protein, partial [Gammaproteobacteria bacterium]|nr:cadherin-like beta sandwich domain-containing protein [Gammaproteobacteria bacterium]